MNTFGAQRRDIGFEAATGRHPGIDLLRHFWRGLPLQGRQHQQHDGCEQAGPTEGHGQHPRHVGPGVELVIGKGFIPPLEAFNRGPVEHQRPQRQRSEQAAEQQRKANQAQAADPDPPGRLVRERLRRLGRRRPQWRDQPRGQHPRTGQRHQRQQGQQTHADEGPGLPPRPQQVRARLLRELLGHRAGAVAEFAGLVAPPHQGRRPPEDHQRAGEFSHVPALLLQQGNLVKGVEGTLVFAHGQPEATDQLQHLEEALRLGEIRRQDRQLVHVGFDLEQALDTAHRKIGEQAEDIDQLPQFGISVADRQIGFDQLGADPLLQRLRLVGQQQRCAEHLGLGQAHEVVSCRVEDDLLELRGHGVQTAGDGGEPLGFRVAGILAYGGLRQPLGIVEVVVEQRNLPQQHQHGGGRPALGKVLQQGLNGGDIALGHGQLSQRIVGEIGQEGQFGRGLFLRGGLSHQLCQRILALGVDAGEHQPAVEPGFLGFLPGVGEEVFVGAGVLLVGQHSAPGFDQPTDPALLLGEALTLCGRRRCRQGEQHRKNHGHERARQHPHPPADTRARPGVHTGVASI